ARTIAQSLTAAGAIMGTPAYMSPEQCSGLPADTRSDQFSFCVSLYEGLYGERPFAGESLSSLILAVCQGQVREAPRGSSVPTWLRRVLLRGLSVKPSERWPSMQALAEALSADPIKRRRTWLGAAAVAASLATGVLGAWQPWVGGVCGGAGERLGQVWGSAQKTAVRSALLATGFGYAEESWSLVERRLDEYAASWASIYTAACEAHHRGETSGDLYDRQMACLESRLGEVRMMVDVLAAADATVLQQTSEILVGLPPLSTCGDTDSLSKSYAPPPDQKTAEAVEALRQRISSIHMRAESGHAIEVIDEAEGVVRAARTLGYRPLLAEALFTLGRVYLSLYQSPQAEEALLDAFLTADAVRHDGIAATAGAWLVFLNARNGRDTEARLRAEHVKAVIERYGQTTTADVNLHRGLATLEFVAGRYDEARRGFKHALAIAESLPEGQGERLATLIHVNIGQVCEVQGDVACMSSNFERAMERMSERVGAGDPKLGMYRYMLAKARVTQGRGDEAQALIQESLADIHRAFGERHNMYVTALMWSGEVNFYQGRVAEALAQSQEALTLGREVYGENHAEVLGLTLSVAEYLRTGGRLEEARARVEEADAIKGRLGESAGFMAAKVDHIRGQVLADAGDLEGARSALEAFLAAREKYGPSLGPDRATAAARLAQVKIELGDRVAGAALLAEARRSIESISEDHWALVEILKISGEVALAEGRRADAATDAERALRILDRYGCFRHDRTAVAFLAARALIDDDRARALRLAEEALANEAAVSGVAGSRGEAIRAWLAAQGG
ncbi:MAG: tetratricopeptide repeat protein, partial [Myxococcales bacterium]|nr:tetratricopeptide repeat protein [Myxococcales bacterium]